MILHQIKERPACLKHLENDKNWYEMRHEDKIFGYLALKFMFNEGEVHMEIQNWTPQIAKHLKNNMYELRAICKKNGCVRLAGINKDIKDERWSKMLRFLGFSKPVIMAVSVLEV